jgi:8-oxo-dGTP diphosphatase
VGRVRGAVQRRVLQAFGRLPRGVRRRVAMTVAPSWMVGALAVLERDGRVLLVRPVYRRVWALPGGVVSRGETPGEAVVREVREETGLEVRVVGPGACVVDAGPRRVDFAFRVEQTAAGEPKADPSEIAEVGWFAWDDLPEMGFEAHSALEALAHPELCPWSIRAGESTAWMA